MLTGAKLILSTRETPEIYLNPEGIIRIKGRCMGNSLSGFAATVIEWIDDYVSDPAAKTCVDIYCEYLSGIKSTTLISLLKKLILVKLQDKEVIINWYYDDGDDDMLEQGEYISSTIGMPFNFIIISG